MSVEGQFKTLDKKSELIKDELMELGQQWVLICISVVLYVNSGQKSLYRKTKKKKNAEMLYILGYPMLVLFYSTNRRVDEGQTLTHQMLL